MKYLLDTNVFIQAKNLHRGLDSCPAFWDCLIAQNAAKRVFRIDKVADEIDAGNDELTQWAKQHSALFHPTDANAIARLGKVSEWINDQNYEPAARSKFAQDADFYLIAHALTTGATLITHEIASNSLKNVKIPDVCKGLSVDFDTPFAMLRHEQAQFVLNTPNKPTP